MERMMELVTETAPPAPPLHGQGSNRSTVGKSLWLLVLLMNGELVNASAVQSNIHCKIFNKKTASNL